MIRAAAKNYQDVAVVTSPDDYAAIVEEMRSSGGSLSLETHWRLAKQAFSTDGGVRSCSFARGSRKYHRRETPFPSMLDIRAPRTLALRYGENPHQSAALYCELEPRESPAADQLQGKELSYNNLVDLDAAWQLIDEFDNPASAIIKHTNPCGCAEAAGLAASYRRAFEADPISAYGGVLAFNRDAGSRNCGGDRKDVC